MTAFACDLEPFNTLITSVIIPFISFLIAALPMALVIMAAVVVMKAVKSGEPE